jgi:hypothetical protein
VAFFFARITRIKANYTNDVLFALWANANYAPARMTGRTGITRIARIIVSILISAFLLFRILLSSAKMLKLAGVFVPRRLRLRRITRRIHKGHKENIFESCLLIFQPSTVRRKKGTSGVLALNSKTQTFEEQRAQCLPAAGSRNREGLFGFQLR